MVVSSSQVASPNVSTSRLAPSLSSTARRRLLPGTMPVTAWRGGLRVGGGAYVKLGRHVRIATRDLDAFIAASRVDVAELPAAARKGA